MTTGLVLTLSATCSDLRGSSPDQAIKLSTCTATANLLFVDISIASGNHGPPFCNHYSYKLNFVKYIVLRELGRHTDVIVGVALRGHPSLHLISVRKKGSHGGPPVQSCGGFQILDKGEEDVDVDGLGY